jgi:hypothetical protein
MLTAGVLLFDDLGRIRITSDPPTDFNGGTPTAHGGLLAASAIEPTVYFAALGYGPQSRLTNTTSPLNPQGPLTNREGQIRVSSDPPHHWYAGLPFTVDDMLSVAAAVTPSAYAFDNAFNNAFDSPAAA